MRDSKSTRVLQYDDLRIVNLKKCALTRRKSSRQ